MKTKSVSQGFPGGSVVKNTPAVQETWVPPLGQEDPLEKEMTTHSCILAWEIPWTEEPDRLHSPWGHKELDTTQQLNKKKQQPESLFDIYMVDIIISDRESQ